MHAKQQGFTLIELLVVIAIIAIMAVIALPNMSQWIASRRVASNAEQIANLLRFARSEAVRLNLPVYICPVQIKKDGKSNGSCNASFSNQGLMAFADADKNKQYERANDIQLRAIILNSKNNDRVTHSYYTYPFSGSKTSDNITRWTFLPNGNFVRWNKSPSATDNFPTPSGYTQIILTDSRASSDDDKKARAGVLFIDGSGRVEICAKSDSRDICQYSEK
ncbi:GspH/FimT family pseudopilin [Neisseria yangbaofengii]|uniref:GspH/FimT family pseudopilin n=1 Tax=Neisseria yangbaofengii TaxID=2709396 RepID=UPI0013ED5398|nr:GspH/FimT family pseudopilin [Neisseria yangbaofengii]